MNWAESFPLARQESGLNGNGFWSKRRLLIMRMLDDIYDALTIWISSATPEKMSGIGPCLSFALSHLFTAARAARCWLWNLAVGYCSGYLRRHLRIYVLPADREPGNWQVS